MTVEPEQHVELYCISKSRFVVTTHCDILGDGWGNPRLPRNRAAAIYPAALRHLQFKVWYCLVCVFADSVAAPLPVRGLH